MTFDELASLLGLGAEDSRHLSAMLSRAPQEVLDDWLSKIETDDRGNIKGTFYADLGSHLSFNDFQFIYQCLGYDFRKLVWWQNWYCNNFLHQCVSRPGYSCNPDICSGTIVNGGDGDGGDGDGGDGDGGDGDRADGGGLLRRAGSRNRTSRRAPE
jgi:hypothetical protein